MKKDNEATLKALVAALEEKKAEAVETVDVSNQTPFDDYFLLATAGNPRQLNALVDALEEALEKLGLEIEHRDGTPESGWIALEADAILVHLFLPEMRESVGLDKLLEESKRREA